MSSRKNIQQRASNPKPRSTFAAFRLVGAAAVSALSVVGLLPPQAALAAPAPARTTTKPAHQLSQHWSQQEIAQALTQLEEAVRKAKPKQGAVKQSSPKQTTLKQSKPAGAKSTLAGQSAADPDDSDDDDSDGNDVDYDELPSSLSRGAGYDQITAAALQDPDTAQALHMMARFERHQVTRAAEDTDDSDDTDGPAGGDGNGQTSDPALASVLSLNNGPILYQPPCPFGWPPPDRYGGLADIIELAPMAGSFVSEAFAPAAAWQPMAQLFGPLIAIIQPTIKQNRYWIDPTIINVQNPINAIHFLFFGWYDVWHRKKFLQEEVEWANEVAPWLQQVYQTPQAACFVAFEGMFQRLVETGNPWPRGWYVEDHATTWDIDKIGPYEPASPGSRPKALEELDHQLAKQDAEGDENVPPAQQGAPVKPQQPKAQTPAQPREDEPQPAPPQSPPPNTPPPPQRDPSEEVGRHESDARAGAATKDSFLAIDAGVEVR